MTLENPKGHKVVVARAQCQAPIVTEDGVNRGKCDGAAIALVWVPNMHLGEETGGDWISFCESCAVGALQHRCELSSK